MGFDYNEKCCCFLSFNLVSFCLDLLDFDNNVYYNSKMKIGIIYCVVLMSYCR